ncbi:hypothetical protein ABIE26_000938 [Pedobacter africanus]
MLLVLPVADGKKYTRIVMVLQQLHTMAAFKSTDPGLYCLEQLLKFFYKFRMEMHFNQTYQHSLRMKFDPDDVVQMQAQQAAGLALVDGNLEVVTDAKQAEFFAFRNFIVMPA